MSYLQSVGRYTDGCSFFSTTLVRSIIKLVLSSPCIRWLTDGGSPVDVLGELFGTWLEWNCFPFKCVEYWRTNPLGWIFDRDLSGTTWWLFLLLSEKEEEEEGGRITWSRGSNVLDLFVPRSSLYNWMQMYIARSTSPPLLSDGLPLSGSFTVKDSMPLMTLNNWLARECRSYRLNSDCCRRQYDAEAATRDGG